MVASRQPLPRLATAMVVLLVVSGAAGALAFGADPDSGTVSLESPRTTWKGKEFAQGGNTITPDMCELPSDDFCDEYTLTVDIDPAHWETANGGAEVMIAWKDAQDDFDLHAIDDSGEVVGSSTNVRGTSERLIIEDADREAGPYRILVNPYSVDEGSSYDGSVRVIDRAKVAPGTGDVPTEPVSSLRCENGTAGGIFPCKDVDLEGFLPVPALNDGIELDVTAEPVELNDIWGWTDPRTGREYAIVGKTNGTAFVDITEPTAPRYLGSLPSSQRLAVVEEPITTMYKRWRDIKVYDSHAFIVSEEPGHGMQVFDLRRLRDVTEPRTWDEDALYTRVPTVPGFAPNPEAMGNSHNIAINADSGFAYAIGTDTCDGGPHMIDIREPKNPKFAGCVAEDGYTHDSQCVNYDGPDERFVGREICFNSNEDTLTIVDVTDKENPVQLARETYEGVAYTHQGWLTEDSRYFLLDDELDEIETGENTKTRIFDVSRLDSPTLRGVYTAGNPAIDHNLYVRGSDVFEANYRSGLRVLDAGSVAEGKLTEKGYFDVYPEDDEAEFNGAWSNYPYYESGLVVVSGIEQGLFVLRPRDLDQTPPTTPPDQPCAASAGFKSVTARPRGRGLRFGFRSATAGPVSIDVFRVAKGRHITEPRLVADFERRSGSVRWSGRMTRPGRRVTDGHYFVRFRVRTEHGRDTRRIALRRRNGRFSAQPDFARRPGCGLLRKFELSGPVFGGRDGRPLGIAFRLSRETRATVTVMRGKRVVRRFRNVTAPVGKTARLRLRDRGLRRGTYRVLLTLGEGDRSTTTALRSRRL